MTSAISATSASNLFSNRTRRRRSTGFTLVELLVVVGIIIALMALLLPMLSKVRKQAKRTRTASDINAIAAALDAYKSDFGDYPRIIYTSPPPNTNGTGSGAELLGKALLSLGDEKTATYNASTVYYAGQIVTTGSAMEYAALQQVPASNPPGSGSAFWAQTSLPGADGADGPGFRIRAGGNGQVHAAYLQSDKFKTRGMAIADADGNPILYFAANPAKPNINLAGPASAFGPNGGNSYVGTAPGVTPGAAPAALTAPCGSFYNYSDNDMQALFAATSDPNFKPNFPSINFMLAMLGNYSINGYINPGETPASTAGFLLWSAGPDGVYGPADDPTVFAGRQPAERKNLVGKCDDVTNFTFAQ